MKALERIKNPTRARCCLVMVRLRIQVITIMMWTATIQAYYHDDDDDNIDSVASYEN